MTAGVAVTDAAGSGLDAGRLAALAAGVLRAENASLALHVVLVHDEEIRRLHRRFRDEDAPTDVLSFPLVTNGDDESAWDPEGEGADAEVVVSVDAARRAAAARGLDVEAELALYLIHGVLHVLGYDDRGEAARARMRRAESRHLAAAGFRPDLFAVEPGGSCGPGSEPGAAGNGRGADCPRVSS